MPDTRSLGRALSLERASLWLVAALVLAHVIVVTKCAWLSDDAFITLRTAENAVSGFGLRWNVAERVQAYTHPLWLFLLIPFYAITREPYYTTIALSIALSAATSIVFIRSIAPGPWAAAAGISILSLSKAFVDYSTSGLENPLTHLLLLLFVIAWFRERDDPESLFWPAIFASLVILNRHDLGLLVIPPLVSSLWTARNLRAVRVVASGLLPVAAWELFSLIYYGFPFPNTAYAKLANGISFSELFGRGVEYMTHSLRLDPVTLVTIVAAMIYALLRAPRRSRALIIGSVAYLSYVVAIGGDFMSGRFLTPVLFIAVILLVKASHSRDSRFLIGALVGALVLGIASPRSPLRAPLAYGATWDKREIVARSGISDERAHYYKTTGLLMPGKDWSDPVSAHHWATQGKQARQERPRVVVKNGVGMFGYFAGPEVFIIDTPALADPLLARLPPRPTREWRVGHFFRAVPPDYVETIRSGENRFRDPNLAKYYDHLSNVTRDPLFSRRRIVNIWRLNLGRHDELLADLS